MKPEYISIHIRTLRKREDDSKRVKTQQSNPKPVTTLDEKTLVQAIVEAYHIIEKDKNGVEAEKIEKLNKKEKSEKWYMNLLFALNVIFFPWKINKAFSINNNIYDGILVLFVSLVLEVIGVVVWGLGVFAIIYDILLLNQGQNLEMFFIILAVSVTIIIFGSLLFLAGKEFSKVIDSNKIYAYSASIIALISCIVAILALIKDFY